MTETKFTGRKPWFEDLVGRRFGRLTVVANEGLLCKTSNHRYWRCECSCGSGIFTIVQGSGLKNGTTKSCGCLKREIMTGSRGRPLAKIPGQVRTLGRYPGYVFTSLGEVWSSWNASRRPCMTMIYYRLRPRKADNDHLTVKVRKETQWLHRLILEAFKGPCPEGLECRHRDGNPANNRPSNLFWGTRSENIRDRIRHGKSANWSGSKHGEVKLDDDKARAIYMLRARGVTLKEIARKFGVSTATVWSVSKGRTWGRATESLRGGRHA